MGCDIHLHVEIKRKNSDIWDHVSFSGQFSDRIYGMFAVLANVRNYNELPHLPIRGLPDDISWRTSGEIYTRVVDKYENDYDRENCYLREDANRWVENGYSFFLDEEENYCSSPDWHSYNWCSPKEMEACVERIFKKENAYIGDNIDWVGLAAYMNSLESTGEYDCRAVFWFDN